MSSTSKSNLRKPKKFEFIPKPKQPTRNWLDLPSDVMANILYRIGVHDILENAQKVCTVWRNICKDPAMWRVIYMGNFPYLNATLPLLNVHKVTAMCKHAMDLSQGQLIDITIVNFGDDELLLHLADRSSQLRRVRIGCCYLEWDWIWTKLFKKNPLIEELSLYTTQISKEAIETAGRYCPMLKTLKLNQEEFDEVDDEEFIVNANEIAIAIGENLHQLEHLELVGDNMSNIGLLSILDGCRHLKSLELRRCFYIDLKGELGKRCSEQIKCLKLPEVHCYDSYDEYPECFNYDGYVEDDPTDFEEANKMLTLMAMFG